MKKLALLLLAGCASEGTTEPEPCAGAPVSKGPWAIKMTGTGTRVRWETRQSGCVEVGFAPEDGSGEEQVAPGTEAPFQVTHGWDVANPPDDTGTFFTATVDLAGLAPGKCYHYTIHAPDEPKGRFCTSRTAGQPIRFMAIGDTNPVLGQTVPLIARFIPRTPDFIVHLGDLQYYSSIAESWQLWFNRMSLLLRAGAFLPCVGNHEDEAAVPNEFTQYYKRFFGGAGDLGDEHFFHFQTGGVHFFSLDTEDKPGLRAGGAQRALLEGLLSSMKASPGFRFSVVYMHRPLYTLAGDAGGPATNARDLRSSLQPLFEANGVKLVLAGHVHSYERFDVGGVPYIVSGGGGGLLSSDMDAGTDDFPEDVPLREAAASKFHAVMIDVGPTTATAEAMDVDGAVIDTFTWPVP